MCTENFRTIKQRHASNSNALKPTTQVMWSPITKYAPATYSEAMGIRAPDMPGMTCKEPFSRRLLVAGPTQLDNSNRDVV